LFNRLLCKQLNKAYKLGIDKKNSARQGGRIKGSTYNRLVSQGGRKRRVMKDSSSGSGAIVSSLPGTTRDRRDCWGRMGGIVFRLMDTAGVNGYRIDGWLAKSNKNKKTKQPPPNPSNQQPSSTPAPPPPIPLQQQEVEELARMETAMMQQTLEAAKESDLIFLMMDAKVGMTQDLMETARWLRRQQLVVGVHSSNHDDKTSTANNHNNNTTSKKIVVLANKLEGNQWLYDDQSSVTEHLEEVLRLGFGPAIPISAQHGEGMVDLAMILQEMMAEREEEEEKQQEEEEQEELPKQNSRRLGETDQANTGSDYPTILSEQDEDWNEFERINDNDDKEEEEEEDMGSMNPPADKKEEKPLQLAIVGRPNVGKSTLVNAILQQERVLTGTTPGLTRDAIAVDWSWNGRPVQLVDTAGIRKLRRCSPSLGGSNSGASLAGGADPSDLWDRAEYRSSVQQNRQVEDMAVANALRAIQMADVVVLVLDAQARVLHRQEINIANAVIQEGRSLVIAANKWDLLAAENIKGKKNVEFTFSDNTNDEDDDDDDKPYTPKDYANDVRTQLEQWVPMLRHTPIVPMSGLTGERVKNLLPVVFDARDRWAQTISTSTLNRWLEEVLFDSRTPNSTTTSSRRLPTKIKYILQTKGRPPTFLLFCNHADVNHIPESFVRYLTKHFQDTFEMYGMPVRMIFKPSAKSNPYDKQSNRNKSNLRRGGKPRRKSNSSGTGVGGKEHRKQRLFHQLRTTGKPAQKHRRSTR
jgi:GTPase